MRLVKSIYLAMAVFGILGCGSKANDPTPSVPPVAPAPTETTKAVLIAPAKDELCMSGIPFTSTMNKIIFKWNASAFALEYTINVKNLVTSHLTSVTLTTTQIEIHLTTNAPYSWSVTTKSSLNNSSLVSDVWRFYNAGEATSSFAPYPAEIVSPLMDAKPYASNGFITLVWRGSDPDADIVSYDIYLGTATNPPMVKSDYGSSSFPFIATSGTTYYWKIVTRDRLGNTSETSVFKFTVA